MRVGWGWRREAHRWGLEVLEAERCGAVCRKPCGSPLQLGHRSYMGILPLPRSLLHPSSCVPAPPPPSLLPPEEVQLEGDRAQSQARADRTKVNMPAIAAASGLWTDDGCWAGEDHTHEAPWTTQAPACPPAGLRHTLARRIAEASVGCFRLVHRVPQPHG